MAEASKTATKKSVVAVEAGTSVYERLCAKIDIAPMSGSVEQVGFQIF